jgi:hypothetical protein
MDRVKLEALVEKEIDYNLYFDGYIYTNCKQRKCETCPVEALAKKILSLEGAPREISNLNGYAEQSQAKYIVYAGREEALRQKYGGTNCPALIDWNNEVIQKKKLEAILG